MKLEHEDPRLIDYVLGELPEDERAAVRAALDDPENADAAAFARELDGLAAISREALSAEAGEIDPIGNTSNVLSFAPKDQSEKKPAAWGMYLRFTAAAVFFVILGASMVLPNTLSYRRNAREAEDKLAQLQESVNRLAAVKEGLAITPSKQKLESRQPAVTAPPANKVAAVREDDAPALGDLPNATITRGADIGGQKTAPAAPEPPQSAPPAVMAAPVPEPKDEDMDTSSAIVTGGTLLVPEQVRALGSAPGPTPRLDGTPAESSDYQGPPGSELMAPSMEAIEEGKKENTQVAANAAPKPAPSTPATTATAVWDFSTIDMSAMETRKFYSNYSVDISGNTTSIAESDEVSRMIQETMPKKEVKAEPERPGLQVAAAATPSPQEPVGGGQESAANRLVEKEKAIEINGDGVALRQLQNLGYLADDRYGVQMARPEPRQSIQFTTPVQFKSVMAEPLSTFAADVDTASYTLARREIEGGRLPEAGRVRTEEFINYFDYAYPEPTGEHPFSVTVDIAGCPWAPEHRLARVGIKGKALDARERPAANLVFLVDVSGSMDSPDKLPLVQESLRGLLETLNERDRVALVTYAGESRVALEPTSCERKDIIRRAIDGLGAGGSTNGAGGISSAYEQARRAFIAGGINRVLIATDGDFNVGVTSQQDLERLITEQAKSGVFLSVLGYGTGNLNDTTLETLADKGNGFYAYIDDIGEARRTLVEKGLSAIATIAKDVKFQIEFNPAKVSHYRQIGYENRQLAAQDFNDDTKDAGDIGPGHTVTALYELVPAGQSPTPGVAPLKYQQTEPAPPVNDSPETMTVKLRYKQPEAQTSQLLQVPVTDAGAAFEAAPADFRFASAVAAFAQVLKGLQLAQAPTLEQIRAVADATKGNDPARQEFVDLVVTTKTMLR